MLNIITTGNCYFVFVFLVPTLVWIQTTKMKIKQTMNIKMIKALDFCFCIFSSYPCLNTNYKNEDKTNNEYKND